MSKGVIIKSKRFKNSDKIYRIIPKERFLQLFTKPHNILVRPSLWDDPFENLALESVVDVNGRKAVLSFKDDLYAQCWSSHKASDAMWRIYSKNMIRGNRDDIRADGIRIRTTVEKLLNSLSGQVPEYTSLSCFIGKVKYLSDKELKDFAQNHFTDGLGSDGVNIAQTLLIKRNAFLHEREVRLIYFSSNKTKLEDNLFSYKIDPHSLIDQIMLHPLLTKEEANKLEAEIKIKTNFKGEIKRSLLYAPPEGFEFKVGGA